MAYKAMVNGKKVEYKKRVALEIIRQYIRIHNNITINELKNIFNTEKFCHPSYIIDENEKEDFIIKRGERGKKEFERRYFSKEDEVIVINNEKIYVCGEWNGNDLNRLIQFVNDELGMEVYSINELENQKELKNEISKVMEEFREDHIKIEGEAKYFFKIIDDETLYPRRFIVNEARKRLGLDEITTIQAKKIKLFYFSPDWPLALLNKFQKTLEENSSAFWFLPEEESLKDSLDDKAYDMQYEDTINKFRSISDVKTSKYGASVFLAKRIKLAILHSKSTDEKITKEVFRFFKGISILSLYSMWEKVFTYLVVTNDIRAIKRLYKNILNALEKLKSVIRFPL
jgi:hypothetical protein